MDYKEFKLLNKMVKALKCEFIFIMPEGIIGSDKELTTISYIQADTKCIKSYELTKDIWSELVKTVEASSSKETLEYNKVIGKLYAINRIGMNPVLGMWHNLVHEMYMFCKSTPDINIPDLKADSQFNEFLTYKAKDGKFDYKVDSTHIISLFSGLIPVNKSDKLSLEIFDIGNENTFISIFNVNKGFCTVRKYIKYLKM